MSASPRIDAPTKPSPPVRASPRLGRTTTDGAILGVAESRDGAIAAAWTRRSLYVTRDAGKHFVRALDGTGAIARAVVADNRAVLVLRRPGALGVQSADGTETWREMPRAVRVPPDIASEGLEPRVEVAAHGSWVVWAVVNVPSGFTLFDGWIASTHDMGEHWIVQSLPATTDYAVPWVDDEGTLRVFQQESDCSYVGFAWLSGRADGRGLRSHTLPRIEQLVLGSVFDREGWLHVSAERCDAAAHCVSDRVTLDDAFRPVHPSPDEARRRAARFAQRDGELARRDHRGWRIVLARARR
jgi:hypothetical protein